jgi:hypothetical protein
MQIYVPNKNGIIPFRRKWLPLKPALTIFRRRPAAPVLNELFTIAKIDVSQIATSGSEHCKVISGILILMLIFPAVTRQLSSSNQFAVTAVARSALVSFEVQPTAGRLSAPEKI